MRRAIARTAFLLLFLLAACGPTIGDACTTTTDCGGALCLNLAYTPGGYCSRSCASDTDCPNGSVCVPDGASRGSSACFRSCSSASACRNGYSCGPAKNTGHQVCVGTSGF